MSSDPANDYFVARDGFRRTDRLLVYHRQKILVRQNSFVWTFPELAADLGPSLTPLLIQGGENGRYLAVHVEADFPLPVDAEFVPLRQLLLANQGIDFQIPGLGNQLVSWHQSQRFCGHCGQPTEPHPGERAVICSACSQSWYPRINPCVIVLVTDGERMLLARHTRYRGNYFSCLAGFVEVGETPEETVVREVREEAGIEISNIRYVRSQSWPFPSQLMLGFFAEYDSGELRPEPGEIEELKWFTPSQIPATPAPGISVAGQLIQLHCERHLQGRHVSVNR